MSGRLLRTPHPDPCILKASLARAEDAVMSWDRPSTLWSTETVGELGRPSLVLPRARTVAWAALRARIRKVGRVQTIREM